MGRSTLDRAPVTRLCLAAILGVVAPETVSASPAADTATEGRIEGAGTVIIGGDACQLIALDDGRFVALKSGVTPNAALPAKARIKITAEPSSEQSCAHAQSVDVKAFHRLPDLMER